MSFNDVTSRQPQVRTSVGGGISSSSSSSSLKGLSTSSVTSSDPMTQLSDSLQLLQKLCLSLKDKITEMRRRKVTPTEKTDLDSKLKELREFESRLKIQIDSQSKSLDSRPRTEVVQQRLAIGKFQKDHERLKGLVQLLSSESSLIKVSMETARNSRRGSNIVQNGSSNDLNENDESEAHRRPGNGQQKTLVALKEVDIDSLIVEERERDIKRINQDILMVNEMFRDMANIVDKQGVMIEEIAVTTESSHDKAQQGLEQVKQAAAHQSACVIS